MVTSNWLLFICLSWHCATVDMALKIPFNDDSNLNLAEASLLVARKHLSQFTTVVIVERSSQPESAQVNRFIWNYLLRHLAATISIQLSIGSYTDQLSNNNVFIVDSVGAFRQLRWQFTVNLNERDFYFLIILTKYTPNYINVVRRIFTLCYQLQVINANIILEHPVLGVSMFSYKIFSDAGCRVVEPFLYFHFNQSLYTLGRVFPEKLIDFHGCPMRVTTRIFAPMTTFTGNTSNPKPIGFWDNLSGIDGALFKFIARRLNFTIELLPLPEVDYNYDSRLNENFADLLNGKADVAIGGFSGSDSNRWKLSSSKHYHHVPFIYVVRGGQSLHAMARLARPFHYWVWIVIAIVFVCGLVGLQFLRFARPDLREFVFGRGNDAPTTNYVAVFLGYPVSRIPRRNFARYVLMIWTLVTLVLRNAYQGSLYDAFRMNKFLRIPSGLHELQKWNYTIILSPDIADLYDFPSNVRVEKVTGAYRDRFKIMEESHRKIATVTLRDNYVNYMASVGFSYGSDLFMINEVIYVYQVVMYFPKHSMFLSAINKKLQAMEDLGLRQYVTKLFTTSPAMFRRSKDRRPEEALTNRRLRALYDIYVAMMAVAGIVFALELWSVRSPRVRRIIELIN